MRRLTSAGDLDGAINELHRQLRDHPKSVVGWYMLGMKLLEAKRWEDAYPAISTAIALDPSHIGAFEQYVEMTLRWESNFEKLDEAKRSFARDLVHHPNRHRDALDFVIPLSIEEAIPLLARSSDPVAAAAIEVNSLLTKPGTRLRDVGGAVQDRLPHLSREDAEEAILRVLLARGRYSNAIKRLEELPPDKVPVASLRRTIRRAIRREQYQQARMLLIYVRRATPNDEDYSERPLGTTALRQRKQNLHLADT